MEIEFMDLLGFGCMSGLFYLCLLYKKSSFRLLRFTSLYVAVFFLILAGAVRAIPDNDMIKRMALCVFIIIYAIGYACSIRNNPTRKEKAVLWYILFMGIIPAAVTMFIFLAFWLAGGM